MQMATIEFARNVCNLPDANTEEVNPSTSNPVIHTMEDQKEKNIKEKFWWKYEAWCLSLQIK